MEGESCKGGSAKTHLGRLCSRIVGAALMAKGVVDVPPLFWESSPNVRPAENSSVGAADVAARVVLVFGAKPTIKAQCSHHT